MRTGVTVYQHWYAPAVKQMAREVWQLSQGVRVRELIAYKLQ
jgi:hypothetical protein